MVLSLATSHGYTCPKKYQSVLWIFKYNLEIVNVFVWSHVPRDTNWYLFFYCEGVRALEEIVQRGFIVSVIGDIQDMTGRCPGQPAVVDSALGWEMGLCDLWRYLLTSVLMWLCVLCLPACVNWRLPRLFCAALQISNFPSPALFLCKFITCCGWRIILFPP